VAGYLRPLERHDGELTCYNDTTHPLYQELGLRPSTPYLHFDTFVNHFPGHRDVIREQLDASPQRYVVSDARSWFPARSPAQFRETDDLLSLLPATARDCFPWNQPVVFRAGPYSVHKVVGPVGKLQPDEAER
jgi:hypothetical protein